MVKAIVRLMKMKSILALFILSVFVGCRKEVNYRQAYEADVHTASMALTALNSLSTGNVDTAVQQLQIHPFITVSFLPTYEGLDDIPESAKADGRRLALNLLEYMEKNPGQVRGSLSSARMCLMGLEDMLTNDLHRARILKLKQQLQESNKPLQDTSQ